MEKTSMRRAKLEYFRLAAAFLVVAIHCSPLTSFSGIADFVLTRAAARVAVPFFFMVTGYFVLGDAEKLRLFLKRTTLIYAAAVILYLPLNIYSDSVPGLRELLLDGSFYHLWYFPAVLLGLVIARLLSKLRHGLSLAALLYALGLLGDSWFGLVRGLPVIAPVYEAIGYTRNGVFFAPLFLMLGRSAKPGQAGRDFAGFAAAFALMLCEALLLRHLGWQKHDSMYLMLPIVMYFLFRLLLIPGGTAPAWIADFTALVYVLHPWCIVLVRAVARLTGLWSLLVGNSLGHYLAVCLLSAAVSAALLPLLKWLKPVQPHAKARAWVEVDEDALLHNARALQGLLPAGCELMPVLKCEAYGHGLVRTARLLSGMGLRAFAVACASEGVELRRAGIRGTILVLGWTAPENLNCLARYRLTQTVTEAAYADALSKAGRNVDVHLKIDTGMHRLGMEPENIGGIERVFSLPHLRVTGMYTHLCVSDSLSPENRRFTESQSERFFALAAELKRRGHDCGALHTQSSYGLLNYPDERCSYVRCGVALYGVRSRAGDDAAAWPGLRPALSLKVRVAQLHELPAGTGLGYGLDFTTTRPSRIAVLAIGYGDGFPRNYGSACVLVNGHRAPVVGRVCMDQMFADVTDCGAVVSGDTVEIDISGLAQYAGTITNEILSRLGQRLPRCRAGK